MAPATRGCWPCVFSRSPIRTWRPRWRYSKWRSRQKRRRRTTTCPEGAAMAEPNLAQRLGYGADAKLVIVNADDLGSCHSANVGVYECPATGTVTSATLMVPCPWAREASSRYRGEDIGVHLTVNAEYELYRWGAITYAPSLLGGDGGVPRG